MKSDLLEQSPDSAVWRHPGSDFESEETRYAGREPQELLTDPDEPADDPENEGKILSFAALSISDADVATVTDKPPLTQVFVELDEPEELDTEAIPAEGESHRVLDNTVPFHPGDPLCETN